MSGAEPPKSTDVSPKRADQEQECQDIQVPSPTGRGPSDAAETPATSSYNSQDYEGMSAGADSSTTGIRSGTRARHLPDVAVPQVVVDKLLLTSLLLPYTLSLFSLTCGVYKVVSFCC
eukprot:GHVS01069240.1.p1 GENE.GHVS01069240.1~~GHVS01069240.1.p1  ORF type:complete len:118 (-),score=22.88 GHVS01069240.1:244-597(-)